MKRLLMITVAVAPLALAGASVSAAETFVRMISGPSGGSWYPYGAKMMAMVGKKVKNISASNGPGAGFANNRNINKKKAEFGWTFAPFPVKRDDQPYFMDAGGRQMVSLPYSAEINDLPQFRAGRSNEEFESMIRHQFDTLYREGANSGRVMAICLHPFVIGVSHRIWVLESALDYIMGHDDVWFATGGEIVDAWLESGATF